jgi:hypothetical protein
MAHQLRLKRGSVNRPRFLFIFIHTVSLSLSSVIRAFAAFFCYAFVWRVADLGRFSVPLFKGLALLLPPVHHWDD